MTTLEQRMQVYRDAALADDPFGAAALAQDLAADQGLHEVGHDGFGIWGDLRVGEVVHRMRWVWPGTFVMGSPEIGRANWENPQHEVTLTRGFWLGETPVTRALWVAVMGSEKPSHFVRPTHHPVVEVSWHDARAFCKALKERLPSLLPRLPSEAEWECACRAGTTTATWAGSDRPLDDIAWFAENNSGTQPVGLKAPNPWGLHDTLGSVREWCADGLRTYDSTPQEDPYGRGTQRALRGGHRSTVARSLRAACRYTRKPDVRLSFVGFRLAGGRAPRGEAQEAEPTRSGDPTDG